MRKLLLLLMFCAAFGALAQAPQRILPPGERGTLGENEPLPYVKIGNNLMRLAPGGVIFDENNRSIVHGALPARADVLYTKNANGEIQRIYILSEQEKARLEQTRSR